MLVPVRRLTVGLLLARALLAGGASPAPVWEVGDLDCYDIYGAWFTVYQPDPRDFDGDYDGYGCEWN